MSQERAADCEEGCGGNLVIGHPSVMLLAITFSTCDPMQCGRQELQ
jgi:hypothetical protein